MSLSRCVASVVLFGLCCGFAWGQEPGGGGNPPPPPPVNDIKFDMPPPGGLNPDSPAAKTVTAKGTITTATGWTCTKFEFSIVEIPALVQTDSGSKDNPGGTWSFISTKNTSGKSHVVYAKAYFKDANGKTEEKEVSQTVSVK